MLIEKEKLLRIERYAVLGFALLVLSVLQNTPHCFPTVFGCRALLLVPAVVAIAMYERDVAGLFFGLFAGALWDVTSSGTDHYAMLLVIAGFVCGSLVNNTLRVNIVTAWLMSALWLAVSTFGYWGVRYLIGGLDNAPAMLLRRYVPAFFYSLFLSPFLFLLVRAIENKLNPKD